MSAALQDHEVLVRRRRMRRTRTGSWITIVADIIEEKADRPERIHEDVTWPASSIKPVLRDGCWLDGTWPRRGPTGQWWGRALHREIGARAVTAMVIENRRPPERTEA